LLTKVFQKQQSNSWAFVKSKARIGHGAGVHLIGQVIMPIIFAVVDDFTRECLALVAVFEGSAAGKRSDIVFGKFNQPYFHQRRSRYR
jgi:hypothetical protein